jgi:hypothetical protein
MVDRAISHTVTVLERMRNDLAQECPNHPALEKLKIFLSQLDRFAVERPWH